MADLYPEIEPRAQGAMMIGKGQSIFWEEAGNPAGIAALILHGGPGSGTSSAARRFFNPEAYRILSFDQRNCGRSKPYAGEAEVDLSANTTANLVADIERLRGWFGIEKLVIYGNSWGTTLALAYAETHPERVDALVLQGVTTTRQSEIDWLYQGLGALLPEAYAAFRAGAPEGTADADLVAAYNDLMFDPDPEVRHQAALDFHRWEAAMLLAEPGGAWPSRWDDPKYRLARGRICTHYFRHCGFLEDGHLLAQADRLAGIEGVLIQGTDDPQAPPETARELASVWPDARLVLIEGGGHSSAHEAMGEAIAEALDAIAAARTR